MLHVVKYPFEPLDDEKTQKTQEKTLKLNKNSKLGKLKKSAFYGTPIASRNIFPINSLFLDFINYILLQKYY